MTEFTCGMPRGHVDASILDAAAHDSSPIPLPSVLREYHYSFWRIFVYNLVWVTALIVCFALWLLLS